MTTLLERSVDLDVLEGAVADAARSRGSFVLVSGEAGIGKTAFVEAFLEQAGDGVRVLMGFCDDLSTPRPFGPIRDVASAAGSSRLTEALDRGDREEVFDTVLTMLFDPLRVTVLVVEDVHWADDATLDLLRYLARRLRSGRGLVVATYRQDEVVPGHPLQRLLGGVSELPVHRIALRPLTRPAIASLTGERQVDLDRILSVTGGNPFLVVEMLAAGEDEVPATVVDAVLARLRLLGAPARDAVEQLAIIPSAIPHRLATRLVEVAELAELEQRGIVVFASPDSMAFRHEIMRRAIEEALPRSRRIPLHRHALEALLDLDDPDPSQVVHHARPAGDHPSLVTFAPVAAREAARAGARRQALQHYEVVLDLLDAFEAPTRADLLEEHAREAYAAGSGEDALSSQQHAVTLRRELADVRALGAALVWLSRYHWWRSDRTAAETAFQEAIAILEQLDEPTPELAMAYSRRAQLHMLAFEDDVAIVEATRAADLARRVGDDRVLAHALCNLGTSLLRRGTEPGQRLLRESRQMAAAVGADEDVCRAYTNEAWELLRWFRHDEARAVLHEALRYALTTEQVGFYAYLRGTLATSLLATGEWEPAQREARWVLESPEVEQIATLPALYVLAAVLTRRGDPDAARVLEEAWTGAARSRELQRIAPLAALLAEHAWLHDDPTASLERLRDAHAHAARVDFGRDLAMLAYWHWKLGEPRIPAGSGIWRLHLEGAWEQAAEAWRAAGHPYEQALALAESDRPEPTLEALAILDGLGAAPAAQIVRRQLRSQGVQRIPRGSKPVTRANPAGLTPRQLEVLRLLADRRTNAEIAEQLVLSVRTVDHHVAAILQKLQVSSRKEAAAQATRLLAEPSNLTTTEG